MSGAVPKRRGWRLIASVLPVVTAAALVAGCGGSTGETPSLHNALRYGAPVVDELRVECVPTGNTGVETQVVGMTGKGLAVRRTDGAITVTVDNQSAHPVELWTAERAGSPVRSVGPRTADTFQLAQTGAALNLICTDPVHASDDITLQLVWLVD